MHNARISELLMCSEGKATDHMDVIWCLRLAHALFVVEDQALTKFLFILWFGQGDLFSSSKCLVS